MNCKVFYIPCPKGDAKRIADVLLNEKLVACCNILPAESMYWWEGKRDTAEEEVLMAKTVPAKQEKVINRVKEIHKYKVPCIMMFEGQVNEPYLKYLKITLGEE